MGLGVCVDGDPSTCSRLHCSDTEGWESPGTCEGLPELAHLEERGPAGRLLIPGTREGLCICFLGQQTVPCPLQVCCVLRRPTSRPPRVLYPEMHQVPRHSGVGCGDSVCLTAVMEGLQWE